MDQRAFDEALAGRAELPAAEREALLPLARAEGAAFPGMLVAPGRLFPETFRRADEGLCGIPPFRREPAEEIRFITPRVIGSI